MNEMTSVALQSALRATSEALLKSPKAMLLLATLACAGAAHAQFAGDYERLGGTVGQQIGRTTKQGAAQGIAAAMGQVLGSQIGRSVDDKQRDAQQAERVTKAAQEQAKADAAYQAAYDAERMRIDPSYKPGSDGYAAIAKRAAASVSQWGGASKIFSSVDSQMAALQREWQQRNARAAAAPAEASADLAQPRP